MRLLRRVAFERMRLAAAAARRDVEKAASRAARHAPPPPEGPLRALFLASQPRGHAGTEHRLALWASRLRGAGHEVEVVAPVEGDEGERLFRWANLEDRVRYHRDMLRSRRAAVARAARFHVAVVHMTDLPGWEYGDPFVAQALARTAGRLLVDLDDLPVVRGEKEPGERARALVRSADGLVVGNEELRAWFPERPSWVVPTCVEPAAWPVPDRAARAGGAVLGWIGTAGGLADLEALAPVLTQVCARHGARVRVVCDVRPQLPGVPVEFVPWRAGGEPGALAAVDVGLAPLADGPAARCKCGLKAIEYGAVGAPTVASPVGALRAIVAPGVTGLHAGPLPEWASALDSLLSDRAARLRMGAAARDAVESRWSAAANERAFDDALRGRGGAGSQPLDSCRHG